MLQADVRPGIPLEKVENVLEAQVAAFLKNGPTQEEVDRARTQLRAAWR